MPITRIVSGGQTGADRGGIDAAICCELPYGGWVPKGRKAEDGVIPEKYEGLVETESAEYPVRNEANVVDSDATAVFTYGKAGRGSALTIRLARKHRKPCLHIAIDECSLDDAVQRIVDWFAGRLDIAAPPAQCVLNVAGSRESNAPGIQQAVMIRMVNALGRVNPDCRGVYPLREEA